LCDFKPSSIFLLTKAVDSAIQHQTSNDRLDYDCYKNKHISLQWNQQENSNAM